MAVEAVTCELLSAKILCFARISNPRPEIWAKFTPFSAQARLLIGLVRCIAMVPVWKPGHSPAILQNRVRGGARFMRAILEASRRALDLRTTT